MAPSGRHDTPSDDEGGAGDRKGDATVEKPPQRGAEIVGMDDDQELNPSEDADHHAGRRERELREALLRRLDEKQDVKTEVKSEPRSRSRSPRRRRSRSRSRSRDRGRDDDRDRKRRRSRSPDRRRGDSRERGREQRGPPAREGDWTCPKCR
jgi:hypothetical protein